MFVCCVHCYSITPVSSLSAAATELKQGYTLPGLEGRNGDYSDHYLYTNERPHHNHLHCVLVYYISSPVSSLAAATELKLGYTLPGLEGRNGGYSDHYLYTNERPHHNHLHCVLVYYISSPVSSLVAATGLKLSDC